MRTTRRENQGFISESVSRRIVDEINSIRLTEGMIPSHSINEARINQVISKYNKILVENRADYRGQIISEMARSIKAKHPHLSDEYCQQLSEGFFDSLTKKFSKVADKIGKTFTPNSKIDWEQQAKTVGLDSEYEKLVDKTSGKVVSKLFSDIEAQSKEIDAGLGSKSADPFPFSENKEAFFQGVLDIAAFYDSLVKDAKVNPSKASMYNEMIEDLKLAVQKWMNDVKTKEGGAYAYFGGGDAGKYADKMQEQRADGRFASMGLGKLAGRRKKDLEARKAIDKETVTQGSKRGSEALKGAQGEDSEEMNFLSLKKPIATAVAGLLVGSLGAALAKQVATNFATKITADSDLASSMKPLNQLKADKQGLKTVAKKVYTTFTDSASGLTQDITVESGESLVGLMDRMSGGQFDLRSQPTVGELREFFKWFGGGDAGRGVQMFSNIDGMRDSGGAAEILSKIGDKSFGDGDSVWGTIFTGDNGLGPNGELNILSGTLIPANTRMAIVKKVIITLGKNAGKGVAKKAAVAGAAKAIGGKSAAGLSAGAIAAPALAFLGASLFASGAAVAGLRKYAKTNSRLATLNQLHKLLQPIGTNESRAVSSRPARMSTRGGETRMQQIIRDEIRRLVKN